MKTYKYITRFFGRRNKKHFIGYLDDDHTNYGQTNWMNFLIEDDDILGKKYAIWDKVSTDFKKEFDSEPVYNNFFLNTNIKAYIDKATITNLSIITSFEYKNKSLH